MTADYDINIFLGLPLRRVMQEHRGHPAQVWSCNPAEVGDCFRACIASLLDQPLELVPHFAWRRNLAEYLAGIELPWSDFRMAREWMRDAHGVDLACASAAAQVDSDTHYIATAGSHRFPGRYHAVICHRGQVVHDPSGHDGYTADDLLDDDVAYLIVEPYDPDPVELCRQWAADTIHARYEADQIA